MNALFTVFRATATVLFLKPGELSRLFSSANAIATMFLMAGVLLIYCSTRKKKT